MINRILDSLLNEKGIEYFDIIVNEGYETKYRYKSKGTIGNEILQLYSMSKGLTITSAMRLIEKGIISLDDKVSKFFPCFKETYYTDGDRLFKNTDEIRLFNLFTMTSGMSYDVDAEEILKVTERLGDKARLCDYVPAFAKTPLMFPVGKGFKYSLSHDLLAAVVEKAADKPFEDFVADEIFTPLEMKTSTFKNTVDGVYKKLSCDTDGNLTPAPIENALLFSKSYVSGGAGMNSTIEDYMKFVSALCCGGIAHNGYRLLKEESVKALTSPVLDWDFIGQELNWLPDDYSYGLGVRVRTKDSLHGPMKGEFGWDGAAGSFWLADPKRKISVVMGMNILSWENKYRGIHFEILEEIYKNVINS